jgi:hypothetical protein
VETKLVFGRNAEGKNQAVLVSNGEAVEVSVLSGYVTVAGLTESGVMVPIKLNESGGIL